MIGNYLKLAVRALWKNKLLSFINLFGLGLSMSVGMMIMIRLLDQLNYDTFHPSPGKTYRILSTYHKTSGEEWKFASTPLPLFHQLQEDKNNIGVIVSIYPTLGGKTSVDGKELYINAAFTQPSFFKVFGFRLLSGNETTALQQPNSIILTQKTCERFFGTTDALGKLIKVESKGDYVVSGVLEESPGKSHLSFEGYASASTIPLLESNQQLAKNSEDWFNFRTAYTYVLLKSTANKKLLQTNLNAVAQTLNAQNKDGVTAFELQRLDKITPGTEQLMNEISSGSGWSKLLFEIAVALLILLAACFNYTNLSIGRALTRAKEVGIRKISGARRIQLFSQYLVESMLTSLLALCFAWLLLSFIIRYAPFNDGYEFIPSATHYTTQLILWSIGFALFTGILAGISPAWILSSFQPLRVLKNMTTARIFGKVSLQKSLIVFQYSLSLVIIIFLSVFYRQFSYMGNADPGFATENVLVVDIHGVDETIAAQKLGQVNGVEKIAALSSQFSGKFNGMSMQVWQTNPKEALPLNYYYTDDHFIPDMQLSLLSGNNFSAASSAVNEQYLILNEKAVQALDIKNVADAPGKKVWINDSTQMEIAAVVKDFHYEVSGRPIRPLALRYNPAACTYLYLQTNQTDKELLQRRIHTAWINIAGNKPLAMQWLDDTLEEANSQTATISLLGYLAFIAISIATLGLLGLVIYSIEVKRKEISIRKIIGATEKQLLSMLSKKFVSLLVIAGAIAVPIGYTAGVLFLQNFSVRVGFGLLNAIFCFVILLAIGLLTIVSQTYKAATENPVNNLRQE